jgi:hypothetical protein
VSRLKVLKLTMSRLGLLLGATIFPFVVIAGTTLEITQVPTEKAIVDYCASAKRSSSEKKTISVVLAVTKSVDCKTLFLQFSNSKHNMLNVSKEQLSDITLLSYIPRIHSLTIDDNQISDLSPLSKSYEMHFLSIRRNPIVDVSALANLSSLKSIWFDKVQLKLSTPACPTATRSTALNNICFDKAKFNETFAATSNDENPTNEELAGILSAALQDEGLRMYYHADSDPSRYPLRVVLTGVKLPKLFTLSIPNIPVVFEKRPKLYPLTIDLQKHGTLAIIKLEYPVEGVFGSIYLENKDASWVVVHSQIFE